MSKIPTIVLYYPEVSNLPQEKELQLFYLSLPATFKGVKWANGDIKRAILHASNFLKTCVHQIDYNRLSIQGNTTASFQIKPRLS